MSAEIPRVVVVGSLHFDIMVQAPYLPRPGETLMGQAWWWKPGGKGGNQAIAAARHGALVEFIGSLGGDGFGARLREGLSAAGVGVSHVETTQQGSGMSVAIQQDDGDYAAIVVSGANREVDAAQIAACRAVIAAGSVLLLQNEIAESANAAAARFARDAGVKVILNAAPARPVEALEGLVDILVVNAIEAEMLGCGAVDGLSSATGAARRLQTMASTVIVTAGADGVAAVSDGQVWSISGHAVSNGETHGAGDVFVGAFAAQFAQAAPMTEALAYANAAAALHVGTPAAARDAIGPANVAALLSESAPRT